MSRFLLKTIPLLDRPEFRRGASPDSLSQSSQLRSPMKHSLFRCPADSVQHPLPPLTPYICRPPYRASFGFVKKILRFIFIHFLASHFGPFLLITVIFHFDPDCDYSRIFCSMNVLTKTRLHWIKIRSGFTSRFQIAQDPVFDPTAT